MNADQNGKYWTWLRGALLLLVISGSVTVFVLSPPSAPSEGLAVTSEASPAEDRYGYQIRASQNEIPGLAQESTLERKQNAKDLTVTNLEKPRTTRVLNRYAEVKTKRLEKDKLTMPEWDRVINPGGTLRDDLNEKGFTGSNGIADFVDLYNGIEAEFIPEILSNGVATDMSALLSGPNLSDEVLFNGAVRAEHDLGNAYVMATIGADEHLRLYAGVERLITEAGTFIEIEFNQNKVNLSSGAPWPIDGKRVEGDVLVRLIFSNRILQSVQLEQWQKNGFRFVNTGAGISGDTCLEMRKFMYCVGPPPIRHPEDGFEAWDEDGKPLDPILADDFVEVGIDVDLLVGQRAKFTSVLFRTPEDIVMNNFRVFEPLAHIGEPGVAR